MDKNLFLPKSIAVIGASNNSKKIGYQVLKNIIDGGYSGKIYPINIDPKDKSILGLKRYSSILEIKQKIDMAVFVIPANFVPEVLEQCGQRKTKTAVIISAGFRESGENGIEREREIVNVARKFKIRILGPNCLGFIDSSKKINATFAQAMPISGNVALVSQSGAICTAIIDWARKNNIGFSKIFSIGNKADINELDLIELLSKDKNTKVIATYLESIEEKLGKKTTREILYECAKRKPIIILKAGTSIKGMTASSSHTGAITGSNESIDALFKQCGIIKAESLEDLYDLAELFSSSNILDGNKIAVVTNAGGPGVMITDAIEKTTLEMANLKNATIEKFKKQLPPNSNVNNPIDVIGDADAKRYKKALDIIENDKNVNVIFTLLAPQSSTEIEKTANIIIDRIKKSKKTIIPVFMGGKRVSAGTNIFEKNKTVIFEYPERAVKAAEQSYLYNEFKKNPKPEYSTKKLINARGLRNVELILHAQEKSNQKLIVGKTADNIIRSYGLPTLESKDAKNIKQVEEFSKRIGFPIVMKINSPDIIHKSDVGGVIVNINNSAEAKKAFLSISRNAKKNCPKAQLDGVTLYKMFNEGTDFYIGAKRDPILGPVISFGLGGIYVEILHDISFRLAPLSSSDIEKMIGETKSSKIIFGARGKKPLDKKIITDTLIRVSNIMMNHPQIIELDINPIRVAEKTGAILDCRIIVK